MGRMLVLLALTAGCAGGTTERLPGQDEAEAIIWRQMLQRTDDPPPVEWVDVADGWIGGTHGGATWAGWKVQVNYWPHHAEQGVAMFSVTNLAHEFIHYDYWMRTGDVDPLHFRADWKIEEKANSAMIERGL